MENKITFNGVDSKKSNTKKENTKKIIIRIVNIFCYIATIFLAILLIVSFTYKPNKSQLNIPHPLNRKFDNIQLVEDSPSFVVYDDINHDITLSVDELDYSYENFYTIIDNMYYDYAQQITTVLFEYNSNEYGFNSFDQTLSGYKFYSSSASDFIIISSENDYKFSSIDNNSLVPLSHDLTIVVDNAIEYNDIKTAIESDIPSSPSSPTISIFEGITSSVSSFISTLNSGITAIIGIFWANNALTPIGILTTIVVGVSIVYFLFSLVIGLIRLRG